MHLILVKCYMNVIVPKSLSFAFSLFTYSKRMSVNSITALQETQIASMFYCTTKNVYPQYA